MLPISDVMLEPIFSGQDQGQDGGGELQNKHVAGAQPDQVGGKNGIHQVVGKLNGHDSAREEGDDYHNAHGIDAQPLDLPEQLPDIHLVFLRPGKHLAQHPEVTADVKKIVHVNNLVVQKYKVIHRAGTFARRFSQECRDLEFRRGRMENLGIFGKLKRTRHEQ